MSGRSSPRHRQRATARRAGQRRRAYARRERSHAQFHFASAENCVGLADGLALETPVRAAHDGSAWALQTPAGPVRAPLTDLKPDEMVQLDALIQSLGPQ